MFTGYDDRVMVHNQIQNEGTGIFATDALRTSNAALMEGHAAAQKRREELSVEAKPVPTSLTELLSVLHKHGAIADDALGAGAEDTCGSKEKRKEQSDSDSDNGCSIDESDRQELTSFFGGRGGGGVGGACKAKMGGAGGGGGGGAAKMAAKAAGASARKPAGGSCFGGSSGSQTGKSQTGNRTCQGDNIGGSGSGDALGAGAGNGDIDKRSIARLDGRTVRLQSSVSESLAKILGGLSNVDLEEGPKCTALDKTTKAEFQKVVSRHTTAANSTKTACRTLLQRINSSPAAEALSEERKQIDAALAQANALTELFASVKTQHPLPDDLIALFEQVHKYGYKFSLQYLSLYCQAVATQCVQFNDFKKLVAAATTESRQATVLLML